MNKSRYMTSSQLPITNYQLPLSPRERVATALRHTEPDHARLQAIAQELGQLAPASQEARPAGRTPLTPSRTVTRQGLTIRP